MNPDKCRDLRHAWEYTRDVSIEEKRHGSVVSFTRLLVCDRCGTVRYDRFMVVGQSLVKKHTKYKYLADYKLPKGTHIEDIRYQLFKAGDI